MMTPAQRIGLVLAVIPVVCAGETRGCETLVRDAAFDATRDVHRLCVIASADDARARSTIERLTRWLEQDGKDVNLELVSVNADDADVHWTNYGIPSAPPSLPVVVLVGRDRGAGRSFVIDYWEPEPTPDDLALLADSPARQAVQQRLGKNLAVLLYAPGSEAESPAEPQQTGSTLNEIADQWSERTRLGLSIVRVDRTDPAERVLLSFLGVRPGGPDWVGVVFGRGKLMAPPLEGSDIEPPRLNELLEQLVLACSCSKPMESLGVDLPMRWDDQLDATFIAISDPDEQPDDSYVELALPALMEDGPSTETVEESASESPGTAAIDTTSEQRQLQLAAVVPESAPAGGSAAVSVDAADLRKPSIRGGSLLTIAVGTVGVLVLAVVVLSVVVLAGKGGPATRSERPPES